MFSARHLLVAAALAAAALSVTGCSAAVTPPPVVTVPAPSAAATTAPPTQSVADGCKLYKKATAATYADMKASIGAVSSNPALAGTKFRGYAKAVEAVAPQLTNPSLSLVSNAVATKARAFGSSFDKYLANKSPSNLRAVESALLGVDSSSEAIDALCD